MKLRYIVAVGIFLVANALASGVGKCPVYRSMNSFNMSRFQGEWFEVERSFYLYELSYGCTSLNFTVNQKNNFHIVGSMKNRWDGKFKNYFGTGVTIKSSASIFKFKPESKLPFWVNRLLPGAGLYSILYTDYDNMAIIWSCTNLLLAYNDRIWIFSRNRYLTEQLRIEAYKRVISFNLDPERLIVSKNKDCSK